MGALTAQVVPRLPGPKPSSSTLSTGSGSLRGLPGVLAVSCPRVLAAPAPARKAPTGGGGRDMGGSGTRGAATPSGHPWAQHFHPVTLCLFLRKMQEARRCLEDGERTPGGELHLFPRGPLFRLGGCERASVLQTPLPPAWPGPPEDSICAGGLRWTQWLLPCCPWSRWGGWGHLSCCSVSGMPARPSSELG